MRIESKIVSIAALLTALLTSSTEAALIPRAASASPVNQIYQFPNNTWPQYIAVRSNGNLLLTMLTSPDVYEITLTQPATAKLVATVADTNTVFDITEYAPDKFAFVAGNFSLSNFTASQGSSSIHTIDMTQDPPQAVKVLDVADAMFLNGMSTYIPPSHHNPNNDEFVIAGDSIAGTIVLVNLSQKTYRTLAKDKTMNPISPQDGGRNLGINGLNTYNNEIYYTNRDRKLFVHLSIDSSSFETTQPSTHGNPGAQPHHRIPAKSTNTSLANASATVLTSHHLYHGFAFLPPTTDNDNNTLQTYLAGNNTLSNLDPSNTPNNLTELVYNSPLTDLATEKLFAGDTFVQFGRREQDSSTLYVLTTGGLSGNPLNVPLTGGRVLAVDVLALQVDT